MEKPRRNTVTRNPVPGIDLSPLVHGEIQRHHDLLRRRIQETDDPFVLLPAFGCAGCNLWDKGINA